MNIAKEKQDYLGRKQKREEQERLLKEMSEERNRKIRKIDNECIRENNAFKKMSPDEKASKMIITWCWLAYKGAGNKMSYGEWGSSELAAKVFDKVKNYFQKNKTDYCPPAVYNGLIAEKE